ncbi:S8/S53 family peptidase [Auraticoccus monumenti]|uniref:Subtilase family protein n=1 Tax=Auraticoccus monumenti TaxID=675864 RepID=A0A1G6TPM3_9ACTN|nr:S8/S53 family peptidase [Auraticoccus monumenti]SDD30436.1 Subtilase family protein [Auraticoccus monumenti]
MPTSSLAQPSLPPTPPVVAPALLTRFGARVLDPLTAVRTGRTPAPTVYLADRLLVRGAAEDTRTADAVALLGEVAAGLGVPVEVSVDRRDRVVARQLLQTEGGRLLAEATSTRLLLSTPADGRTAPPDAWALLAAARAQAPELARHIHLDHLLTACSETWNGVGGIWGGVGGIWGGVGGIWGGVGGIWGGVSPTPSPYGSPGYGTRVPVSWNGADPRTTAPAVKRPPVVVLLDTGVGEHPWFRDGEGVREVVEVGGIPVGISVSGVGDPELSGVVADAVGGMLDRQSGHGTFIAGVVRQRCPQAELWAVPVMPADGAASEGDLLHALTVLLAQHLDAQARGDSEGVVDVIGLSLGYYHEDPADALDDGPLLALLQLAARSGTAVVAAAGNDATSTPFFPAALAPALTDGVPLTSVGALNPDGRSVALFSNNGSWISTHAPGAQVVSTVPVTLSGALTAGVHVDRDDPLPRTGVDPDTHRSGFAVWSGTSFAAPFVAGDLAAAIAVDEDPVGTDPATMVARGARAVATVLAAREVRR